MALMRLLLCEIKPVLICEWDYVTYSYEPSHLDLHCLPRPYVQVCSVGRAVAEWYSA